MAMMSVPAVLSVKSRNSPHEPVSLSLAGLPAADAVPVDATATLATVAAAMARMPSLRLSVVFILFLTFRIMVLVS
jgi:uncharacterized membrane protein